MKTIWRRSFDALAYPKGSVEREKLNSSALTSEYYPSKKYIITENGEALPYSFTTRKEAELFLSPSPKTP